MIHAWRRGPAPWFHLTSSSTQRHSCGGFPTTPPQLCQCSSSTPLDAQSSHVRLQDGHIWHFVVVLIINPVTALLLRIPAPHLFFFGCCTWKKLRCSSFFKQQRLHLQRFLWLNPFGSSGGWLKSHPFPVSLHEEGSPKGAKQKQGEKVMRSQTKSHQTSQLFACCVPP